LYLTNQAPLANGMYRSRRDKITFARFNIEAVSKTLKPFIYKVFSQLLAKVDAKIFKKETNKIFAY
jgi:hypothetical protein